MAILNLEQISKQDSELKGKKYSFVSLFADSTN